MTDSTLPSGNFKPTKKLPSSYSRPSIEIGGGKSQKKREWRHATALDVREGDTVADLGLVHKVEYLRIADPVEIKVRLTVGEYGPLTFDSTTLLKAFT